MSGMSIYLDIYRHVKDEADFRPTLHVQVPEKDQEKEKKAVTKNWPI